MRREVVCPGRASRLVVGFHVAAGPDAAPEAPPIADLALASWTGLVAVFAWPTFGLMLVGVGIGFAVGILPGLGGPTTLALMLPFVFKMSPVEAFAFLLGMFAVTNTTGDITSILFGIPGEPTSAATIVDGHAMARNGEAGRALGAAMMSSLVGAVFGALVLGLAIPLVRPLVLTFGSPEFFMLALLGITFVAALSGEALLKGLIAGGLGLGLATIGLDPVTSTQRYTFGQLFLWDGIGLVPVTIGFYAIPEVIEMAVYGSSIARLPEGRLGSVWQGVRDTFRHWLLVLRCSAVGTFVAVIPGMGAATTQWLAYAHAVQSSRDRARFGRGAVEGVLAPGAANNSTLGGSLVTTVAFGVPASVGTAILMGAFLIQGLVPGPSMLTPAPKGHLAVTFAMVWTIVVANAITVLVCLFFMNQLARVTQIRGTLLVPLLLTLIYVGAFAEKNVFQDLGIVLLFGAPGLADGAPGLAAAARSCSASCSARSPRTSSSSRPTTTAPPGSSGRACSSCSAIIAAGLLVAGLDRPPPAAPGPADDRRGSRADDARATGLRLDGRDGVQRRDRGAVRLRAVAEPRLRTRARDSSRGRSASRRSPSPSSSSPATRPGAGAARRSTPPPGARTCRQRSPPAGRSRSAAWIVGGFVAIWLLGFSAGTLVTTVLYLAVGARERWPVTRRARPPRPGVRPRALRAGARRPVPAGPAAVWLGYD